MTTFRPNPPAPRWSWRTFWAAISALSALFSAVGLPMAAILAARLHHATQTHAVIINMRNGSTLSRSVRRLTGPVWGLPPDDELHIAVRRAGDIMLAVDPRPCVIFEATFSCPGFRLPPGTKRGESLQLVLVRVGGTDLGDLREVAFSNDLVPRRLPPSAQLTQISVSCA